MLAAAECETEGEAFHFQHLFLAHAAVAHAELYLAATFADGEGEVHARAPLVDALVAGVGTSGTLTGISRTLKTCNPDLYVVAVEPKSSPVLEGGQAGAHKIPGIGANFVPPFYDRSLVSEVISIEDIEAFQGAQISAALEGLCIGISAGAALQAAIKLSKREEMKGKNIVVIFPDSIERYLSMKYFNDKPDNERLS